MAAQEVKSQLSVREYDWADITPSTAVIYELAELENTTPRSLWEGSGATLFDYIDPDALNSLISNDTSTHVSFTVQKYDVSIDKTGISIQSN